MQNITKTLNMVLNDYQISYINISPNFPRFYNFLHVTTFLQSSFIHHHASYFKLLYESWFCVTVVKCRKLLSVAYARIFKGGHQVRMGKDNYEAYALTWCSIIQKMCSLHSLWNGYDVSKFVNENISKNIFYNQTWKHKSSHIIKILSLKCNFVNFDANYTRGNSYSTIWILNKMYIQKL